MRHNAICLGIFLVACARTPPALIPTMKGLSAEPGAPIAAAGPMSCARLFTTPLLEEAPKALSPEEQTVVKKPVDLVLQFGGSGRSEACDDWLASQAPPENAPSSLPTSAPSSQQSGATPQKNEEALWFGVMLGDTRRYDKMRYDFDTKELQERVTIDQLKKDEGAQFRLTNPDLRGESRAYLMLQYELGPYQPALDVLERNKDAPYALRLHVVDTRWRKAFAWRTAVPFLITRGGGIVGVTLTPGLTAEGLFYPAHPTARVESWFLRELALDIGVGSTQAQAGQQQAILLTLGVCWHEFVSLGYAFDVSEGEPRAPYVSFTLFSSRGVFGLIPYEEIRRAIQLSFGNNKNQEVKPE